MRTRTPTPYSKERGHSSLRKSRDAFIVQHRPDAAQPPPRLDPSLRASQPLSDAPSRSFFSYALDRETIRSKRPRRLPDFPPELRLPRKRSATPFRQSFPSMNQILESSQKPPVREYYDRRKKRASLRQRPRRLIHKSKPAHRCCRAGERWRHRQWWSYRTVERPAIVPALESAIATA